MLPDLELADDLWTRGTSHALSAKALTDQAIGEATAQGAQDASQLAFNGKYSVSIHLLIGYAFELLLKAEFLLLGGNPETLRMEIKHDLLQALDAAERSGFQSAISDLRWILQHIREPHHNHQFRYGGPDKIQMPGLETTLPALEVLAKEVGNHLQNSLASR